MAKRTAKKSKSPAATPALAYLDEPDRFAVPAVCVVFGDEPFLKSEVLVKLRGQVLTGDDAELSLARFAGAEAEWRDVSDELSTVAMFGGDRRVVIVEDADEFVSRFRPQLEDYVARHAEGARSGEDRGGGVLVLAVASWPANTRLFKAVAQHGLQVDCKTPTEAALLRWLADRGQRRYELRLQSGAAEEMVSIIGCQPGRLDQELGKLAALVGPGGTVSPAEVREMVGGWQAKTVWQMIDAACDGDPQQTLVELDRLILSGEHPVKLFGSIAYTLRQFAAATQLFVSAEQQGKRVALRAALEQAGVRGWRLSRAESQLKRLGRHRCGRIYRWLLEADLAMKGTASAPHRARQVLEELLIRVAARQQPTPTAATAR